MHLMGEGLQKSAGDKCVPCRPCDRYTLKATIAGALVTMIVQFFGHNCYGCRFCHAGLMIALVDRRHHGCQHRDKDDCLIVAENIDEYAFLFVAIGFVMMFFFKKPKIRYVGQIVFAFGVLFVGLNSMGAAMKPLAKSQAFTDIMLQIKNIPILGLLLGAVSTLVIQSSSAAIGVSQALAGTATDAVGTPLISIYQAVPILLGSNIGTTITAALACIGGSRNAAAAAAIHCLMLSAPSFLCSCSGPSSGWSIAGVLGHRIV